MIPVVTSAIAVLFYQALESKEVLDKATLNRCMLNCLFTIFQRDFLVVSNFNVFVSSVYRKIHHRHIGTE